MSVRLTAARIGIVAAGVGWGSFTAVRTYGPSDAWLWTADAAVIVTFALAAAAALPSARGTSLLSAIVALTWSMAAFAPAALYWHRAAIVLLLLAAPRLWPRQTLSRIVVVVVGLVSLTPYVWSVDDAAIAVTIGLAAVLVVLRRSLSALMLAAAWTAVALFGAGGLWRRAVPDPSMLDLRTLMYSLGLIAIACIVAASAARSPAAILADDVIRVAPTPQGLRDRMAAAVGDPHLQLGWWDAERAAFVDDHGTVVSDDPPAGSAPIKVALADAGQALIVCSSAVATDPQTREALARATVLATEASRLDDELGRRIDEVARSSERLLLAGDAERRDVRRLLDADVAAPLGRLAARLGALGGLSSRSDGPVERAAVLFDRCARQLRDVSVGLPPSELDAGLAEALQVLRAASPLPVELRVEPAAYELTIATALYYICAEALSNAIKHAGASRVKIEIAVEGDACLARVGDDGRGGAIVAVGGGLAGVRDRVVALGGRLELYSPTSGGTVLEVSVPSSAVAVDGGAARYSAIPVEVLG